MCLLSSQVNLLASRNLSEHSLLSAYTGTDNTKILITCHLFPSPHVHKYPQTQNITQTPPTLPKLLHHLPLQPPTYSCPHRYLPSNPVHISPPSPQLNIQTQHFVPLVMSRKPPSFSSFSALDMVSIERTT